MLLKHQYIEPIDKDTMAAAKIALRLLARERGGAERDAGFQLVGNESPVKNVKLS